MNDNLDEVILEYFREYRKKRQELKDLKDKLESANLVIKSLNETISSVTSEVFSMQHIITTMIDTGCDPVEAKLKYENNDSIWKPLNIKGTDDVFAKGTDDVFANSYTTLNGQLVLSTPV
jgi:hypothetical protein